MDGGEGIAAAHDIGDFGEEGTAEGSAGVVAGEVFFFESAGLEEDHGEGVSEDEHGGGGGGGGEVEWAGFAFDAGVEGLVGVAGESGVLSAGEGDEMDAGSFEEGEEVEKFGGFAGLGEGEDGVAIGDEAEVAVEGVLGIEDDGGGSGGVEGGGDFVADVSGFSDADDDNFALGVEGCAEDIDGGGEAGAEAGGHGFDGFDFEVDDGAGVCEVVHGERVTSVRQLLNPEFF